MPIPVAVYPVYSAAVNIAALSTPVMVPTPVAGDVIIIKLTTWDTGNPSGATSGGAQVYNTANTAAPGGFNGYARIDTCTVVGNPAPYAITSAGTAAPSRHGMVVEHYLASSGAFLAAVPAINAVKNGAGLPSAVINTVGPGSVLSWCSVDVSSIDPATRAPLLGATESGLGDFHIGANSVHYSYYATVGASGAYTIGMSSPGGQTWVMAGVEVQFLPPQPPTPADVVWCAQTPTTGWRADGVTTGWFASDPDTNWSAVTPEEDCR